MSYQNFVFQKELVLRAKEMNTPLRSERRTGISWSANLNLPSCSREEQLMSKRRPQIKDQNKLQALEASGVKLDPNTTALKEYIDKVLQEKFTMNDFFKILDAINSQDRFKQHYGVIGLRKILSIDNPPIQPVIDSNLVPRLIEFMQNENEPHLQVKIASK